MTTTMSIPNTNPIKPLSSTGLSMGTSGNLQEFNAEADAGSIFKNKEKNARWVVETADYGDYGN